MRQRRLLFIGSILLLSGCSASNALYEHKFQLVGQQITSNQLSCETIADASFYPGDPSKDLDITFKLTKGSDRLAVTIMDEYISIITATAVEQGESESEKWPILKNDSEHLLAASFQDGPFGSSVYSFALNKKTGLVTWARVEPQFLYIPSAGGFIQYLTCK